MNRNRVLVLGAGFSKPAHGPLLTELLEKEFVEVSDADRDLLVTTDELFKARKLAKNDPNYSFEELFSEFWAGSQIGGTVSAGGHSEPASVLYDNVVRHLLSICKSIKFDRASPWREPYVEFLTKFVTNKGSSTIISFNYDLLVEWCLDQMSLPFDYGNTDQIEFWNAKRRRDLKRLGSIVSILKLHGSCNWGVCDRCTKAASGGVSITAFEKAYAPIRRSPCPVCDHELLNPGIIAPIYGKTSQVSAYRESWIQARDVLRKADEVVIIGYSLPQSDAEARSLFAEINRLNGPAIRLVTGSRAGDLNYATWLTQAIQDGRYKDTKSKVEDYLHPLLSQ